MINIACVYYGDKYTFKYVENLYNMVKRNFTIPHRFICFTDNTVIHRRKEFKNTNIEFKPFKRHDFNGWFNKLQLFSPQSELEGDTLYMDLDVVIMKNIDCFFEIGEDKNFVGIGTAKPVQKLHVQSGNINLTTGNYITWNNGDTQIKSVSGYHLTFLTYSGSTMAERLRIQSNGNVGIGTTNATNKLHIRTGTSGATATPVTSLNGSSNNVTFSSGYSVPEIDHGSGQVLYVENRAPITRAADQTENIKLIVEF